MFSLSYIIGVSWVPINLCIYTYLNAFVFYSVMIYTGLEKQIFGVSLIMANDAHVPSSL